MWPKYLVASVTLLVLLNVHGGQAHIAILDVRVENLLKMQQGIGWPINLHVVKGNEALMRLTSTLANMQGCEVTTPTGLRFDVRNPPSDRYERWSDGCGVRVKNVETSDHGRWRLIAIRGNDSLTGWTEVDVQEDNSSYAPHDSIILQDGKTNAEVELTTLQNSYCLVTQPFSESSLVPGHCRVTLDRTTRAVQGRWNVVVGLPGKVEELQLERNVAVETEQLVSGYKEDASKLHLYCNIAHSEKNITFCRFKKSAATAGFNIMDGLSDGRYSYYGDGFARRHCGMTIETPTAGDYGVWRCTVGLQEWSGNTIKQSTPMQALFRATARMNSGRHRMSASSSVQLKYLYINWADEEADISGYILQGVSLSHMAVRWLYTIHFGNGFIDGSRGVKGIAREHEGTDNDIKTLFVQNDSSLTIRCQAETSLSYCWFQHPNGTAFTPVERDGDDEPDFWYTGGSLQLGDCGITFAHVTDDDVGLWTCHMGLRDHFGVEDTDKVEVRVTGPLAANKKEVDVRMGAEATLYCHTSNGPRPLDYCRFLTPKYVGINIDSSVTAENAILDRFYFTPERSLDYGDCSLTIKAVQAEDIGQWTCAGLLYNGTEEARDNVLVYVSSAARAPLSRAGIIGMSFGFIILAVVLAGTVWYKRGKPIPWQRRRFSSRVTDDISLQTHSGPSSSRNSTHSDSSNEAPQITSSR